LPKEKEQICKQLARPAQCARRHFSRLRSPPYSFFCQRNNPYDSKSINYVSGSRPHVAFVQKTLEGFLLDSLTIRIAWSDTAIGGGKGGIRKYYFDWNGDTLFRDSIDGTAADTFVIKKAFAQGDYTVRVKAEDFDGKYSDVDSMRLTVRSSLPQIISSSAPHAVEKAVVCTVSVTAGRFGGGDSLIFVGK